MYCSPTFQALPHIKSGRVKALGTTGAKPSPVIPDVMPISAQGLPDVVLSTWYAAFAPSNTPAVILDKIRASLKKTFDDAEVRERLRGVGLDPIWVDAAGVTATIASDLQRWTSVAQRAGIRIE